MTVDRADIRNLVERHVAAWSAHDPEGVAASYALDAVFAINRGDPMNGRNEISEMVSGFYAEFPDSVLTLNTVMIAGSHAVYGWTFEGTHKESGAYVKFDGWEEWEFGEDGLVASSLGWYDAEDYERQLVGD